MATKIVTYTVKKGDTLSEIAQKYKSTIGSSLTNAQRVQRLCDLNNLPSKDKIYKGQVLKLNGTPTKTAANNTSKANVNHFGLQSDTDTTIYAAWTWSKSNTDHYATKWEYATGDGIWFVGNDSDVKVKQSTYNAPSNATRVRFRVKPVSKTKSDKKKTSYWTAGWSTEKIYEFKNNPPEAPSSAPTITIEKYQLTATVSNLTMNANQIEFAIAVDDKSTLSPNGWATIKTNAASYTRSITPGRKYKVRCRAYRSSDKKYSDWTDWSSNAETIPAAPKSILYVKSLSTTSVQVKWEKVSTATSFEVEYTTDKRYFNSSNETSTITVTSPEYAEITGLESGQEYFFRVRAKNSVGESSWTEVKSIILGKPPAAPTTWSSTTTCISGEELILYWVHNTEDGSSQVKAQLELTINGSTTTKTITNTTDEDERDKTSSYKVNTSVYTEGTTIKWRVRTMGITNEYGDWSIQRTVDVYAPPTLDLSITDVNGNALEVLAGFPFYVYGIAGPKTQAPIGYHLTITSEKYYETVDQIGNTKIVNVGDQVYSKYFDITEALLVELSANNIDLENNIDYTVTCTVSMNSGLTAEESLSFTVNWEEAEYEPNAEITYDPETYVTHIRPYCEYFPSEIRLVTYDATEETYTLTSTVIDDPKGTEVPGGFTEEGYQVYTGTSTSGSKVYYAIVYQFSIYKVTHNSSTGVYTRTQEEITDPKGTYVEDVHTEDGYPIYTATSSDGTVFYYCFVDQDKPELVENVTLSVYRREFDGSFVELATGIANTKNVYLTDPHPALDYARYRVVAVENATGAVSYYDLPGFEIGETAAIIQWDEDWSTFDPSGSLEEDDLEQPPWKGSLLRLPYNIDVSDKYAPDTSLIKYIGRKRPVAYYGTQLGESSDWKVDVKKDDEETLYALRRLGVWMGNVYVREPSGTGYWANLKISYSQTHDSLVIPVTLTLTRVEGTENATIETNDT